jgi:hypothetical protein
VAVIRRGKGISRTKVGEVVLLFLKNEGSFACVIKSVGVQMCYKECGCANVIKLVKTF